MTNHRIASGVLAALIVTLAAACGGGGHGVAGTTATVSTPSTTTQSPAAAKQQITQVWERFFSGKTSAKQKVSLLQNGSLLAPAVQAQVRSPIAKQTSAKVSSVKLEGPDKAKVVYTIDVAGKPALQHRTGTAVRVNGSWQVGDKSFCSLLGLQGKPPSACKSVS